MTLDTFVYQACGVLTQDIARLRPLALQLKEASSWHEKDQILSNEVTVKEYLLCHAVVDSYLTTLTAQRAYVVKALIAIGQAEHVIDAEMLSVEELLERLSHLIELLLTVETFYHEFGGIVGYHLAMIELLCRPEEKVYSSQARFLPPDMISLEEMTDEVKEAIIHYIDHMDSVAEIYPVGGAADRLRLIDPITKQPLPAASLELCGKTLLERLIEDVQAKEYLYYKLKGAQLTIPLVMMTSKEKNNHERILSFCQDKDFFHRGEKNFFFFCQPSVPTINSEGKWTLQGRLQLLLRPGGHGVIWKLARDAGCFDWLKDRGVDKLLVRQINNPVAAEDYGLLAFCGMGLDRNMSLGFCSCPRVVGSAEGTNVLVEEIKADGFEYTLTNIEYCDFSKYGILDEPRQEGAIYSKYPSNTNILFVDVPAALEAITDRPIPGMLVNLKKIAFQDETGALREEPLARLESMMQNIADSFTESFSEAKTDRALPLRTYLTYNKRQKTISAVKKELSSGAPLIETPEGCFVDMMQNALEMLLLCQMSIIEKGLSALSPLVFYHPCLGPLYSIIAQKICRGCISLGSELDLQIAELLMHDVHTEGSLRITAENITGHIDEKGLRRNSLHTGKCVLRNVKVINDGIDYDQPYVLWKREYIRKQSFHIHILGSGEFFAEDVCFRGDISIVVPDGIRVVARQDGEGVVFTHEPINAATWHWHYYISSSQEIELKVLK